MLTATENLEFERAAELRDKIHAINETIEKQHIIFPGLKIGISLVAMNKITI